jgi:hypothetical protein
MASPSPAGSISFALSLSSARPKLLRSAPAHSVEAETVPSSSVAYAVPSIRRPVLAIPGNHDWYDGLVLFLAFFCKEKPWHLGEWRSYQRRSYFAIRITESWWLWATDIQLADDMDQPQAEFLGDNGIRRGHRAQCGSWAYDSAASLGRHASLQPLCRQRRTSIHHVGRWRGLFAPDPPTRRGRIGKFRGPPRGAEAGHHARSGRP